MHERLGERLALADGDDERGAGGQVGDVVLAEVDEGEAEGQRVGPADRAGGLAGFGQRVGGDQRGGEMQRRHRRPGVAAERVVHARPGRAPEVLADLDHDPPHRLLGQALLGGPPGRRGRHREVDDAAGVEDRREPARGAREVLGMADQDVEQGAVGLEEPEPVDPGQDPVEQADPRQAGEGALEADVGQPAEADRAVDGDRVAGAEPGAKALRDRRREARGP